jgi:hypothetical protein
MDPDKTRLMWRKLSRPRHDDILIHKPIIEHEYSRDAKSLI